MDVCSRFALARTLKYNVRKNDVILLLDGILQGIEPQGMVMRNDNGSQFMAHKVRKYLERNDITQEFTHIATPEENGHIESFHSSISREHINRNCLDSLHHARMVIGGYYRVYNYSRKHRSLKRKSPYQYIKTFFPEFSDKQPFAFSSALSRVPLAGGQAGAGTCPALDKEKQENAIFVQSENQENRKCLLN
jgi:transposase InsO family protein